MKIARTAILSILTLIATVMSCIIPNPSRAAASPPLTVRIDGAPVAAPAFTGMDAGQIMLPLRWTAEQLGANAVSWDPAEKAVTIDMNEDFYHLTMYESFRCALQSQYLPPDRQVLPLPARASQIVLPPLRRDQAFAEYDALLQKANIGVGSPCISITVTNKSQSYMDCEAVYIFENHDGRLYVPAALLEDLFYARFDYDANANQLSIQTADSAEVKQQLERVEQALTPASPEEAKNLWGLGEQTRSGALQYTALAPALRQEAEQEMKAGSYSSWVTGCSSPWVGPITVQEEQKLSDTATEFTVTYPEVTSAPPNPTATEKYTVSRLTVNGREGWFITQFSP